MEIEKKIAFAGPWIGEFGWEIMTWVPYLRKLSRDYDKMYISTFEGMEALYTGFHCEVGFLPHRVESRTDNWMIGVEDATMPAMPELPDHDRLEAEITDHIKPIKEYRLKGEYIRYGSPVVIDIGVLFHARGIKKGAYKNWPDEKWDRMSKEFPRALYIGAGKDLARKRAYTSGNDLAMLMNVIASAAVVIGGSSGVMHLALMCGTPVVTWGDCSNFGDTLKNRYMKTWNPFGTPVTWVGDTWDPEPEQIMKAIKPKNVPAPEVLSIIHEAVASGRYLLSVAFMGQRDGKDAVFSRCGAVGFPDTMMDSAAKQMAKGVEGSIAGAKAERIPVSWH